MAKINRRGLSVLFLIFSAASASAQEAGLEPLQTAFGFSRIQFQTFEPRPLMTAPQAAEASDTARILQSLDLPAPDAATLAWLAKRVPGLDVKSVRVVAFELADTAMSRLADEKATWMDVLSDPAFRGPNLYYVSEATLNAINAKYVSGLIPVAGVADGGKPFQMQGFLAGQGRVELLYNWTDFSFKDESGKRFRIDNGGRLTATIRGPGDINTAGFLTYGAPVICPWARIQRMTKESMYRVRVETSCATRSADLHPVRKR